MLPYFILWLDDGQQYIVCLIYYQHPLFYLAGEAVSEEDGSGDNEEVLGGEQEDTNKSATSLQPKGKRKRMRTKSDFNSRYF